MRNAGYDLVVICMVAVHLAGVIALLRLKEFPQRRRGLLFSWVGPVLFIGAYLIVSRRPESWVPPSLLGLNLYLLTLIALGTCVVKWFVDWSGFTPTIALMCTAFPARYKDRILTMAGEYPTLWRTVVRWWLITHLALVLVVDIVLAVVWWKFIR